jgi:alkane 1-monooxygenase
MSAYKKLGFLMVFILPSLIILGYNLGGVWTFSNILFAYAFIPIIDEIFGKDPQNIEKNDLPALAGEVYFEGVLHVLAYVQVGIVIWACYVFSLGTMSGLEMVGMTLSVMTLGGGAINIAHELGHKLSKIAQFHSKMILMTVCYMHFFIEHNKGHHVHVATPNDPATSKKNQTFYQFWAQSVFGSWLSAWNIEKRRLERVRKSTTSFSNGMIWFALLPILFCGLLTFVLSLQTGTFVWIVPIFFFTQAILAFSTLEAVNYIEHYGLMRKEIKPLRTSESFTFLELQPHGKQFSAFPTPTPTPFQPPRLRSSPLPNPPTF